MWFDVTADDGGTVADFYRDLFGWPVGPGAGDYAGWFSDGGQSSAGVAPAGTSVLVADPGHGLVALFVPAG